jgi:hypothetical protein
VSAERGKLNRRLLVKEKFERGDRVVASGLISSETAAGGPALLSEIQACKVVLWEQADGGELLALARMVLEEPDPPISVGVGLDPIKLSYRASVDRDLLPFPQNRGRSVAVKRLLNRAK